MSPVTWRILALCVLCLLLAHDMLDFKSIGKVTIASLSQEVIMSQHTESDPDSQFFSSKQSSK